MAAAEPVHLVDRINDHTGRKVPFIAFEYFPPRTAEGVTNLYARLERMAALGPLYGDVTWGAGGTTSDLTLELCVEAKKRFGLEMNMHLTCTNMPQEKIAAALEGAKAGGVSNILALRGDPPVGAEKWEVAEGGFACALDLVRYIKREHGSYFGISAAAYPEGHPSVIRKVESHHELTASERTRLIYLEDGQYVCFDEDYAKELAYLKEKVDAGADFLVTQMFFDVPLYFKFVSDCRAIGITAPIVPGIMLIQSFAGFKRMTAFCKSRVPADLLARLEAVKDNEELVKETGIAIGTEMCEQLIAGGAPGLHFYTLNLENATVAILKNLSLTA